MALALNATENELREEGAGGMDPLSLRNFTYVNEYNISDMIQAHLENSNFTGVSVSLFVLLFT